MSLVKRLAASLAIVAVLVIGARAVLRAPQEPKVEENVQYGLADGQKLLLDALVPQPPAANRPACVLIHGGGWSGGTKNDFRTMADGLAKNMGCVCFCVEYRLVANGKNLWPAQLDDVQRSVRWVRANAVKYGVDPKRICAIGGSAGGHLVAFLGTRDTRDNSDASLAKYSSRANCVVDLFGPVDMTVPGLGVNPSISQIVVALIGKTLAEAPEKYRDCSPIRFVDKRTCPFLILHGTADPLVPVEQSRLLSAALTKAGVENKLVIVDGMGHGATRKSDMDTFQAELVPFLKKQLRIP